MKCDRYPDRPTLPLAALNDIPEGMKQGCSHGHPSSFEGSTFPCGGNLKVPK